MTRLATIPLVPLAECIRQFKDRFGKHIDVAEQPDFVELGNLRFWAKLNNEPLLAYYFARYEQAATPELNLAA